MVEGFFAGKLSQMEGTDHPQLMVGWVSHNSAFAEMTPLIDKSFIVKELP